MVLHVRFEEERAPEGTALNWTGTEVTRVASLSVAYIRGTRVGELLAEADDARAPSPESPSELHARPVDSGHL